MNNLEYETTYIEFGGFYHSIHSNQIDGQLEMEIEAQEELEVEAENFHTYYSSWEQVDFPATYQNYIENYCDEFENFIFQEYDLDVSFKKISLVSPREYNFVTDKIACEISKTQVNKLNEYFLKDKEFDKFLLAATQSIDGFHSFYTYEEAKNNRKEILSTYVLKFIADKFYENFEFFYVDICLKDEKEVA